MLHRRAMGFRPLSPLAKASAAGKIGGRRSGAARRREGRRRLIADLERYLAPLQQTLERRQWLRVLATALRVEKRGYQRGRSAKGQAQYRRQKKAAAA
jgi:hypothetical protein